MLDHGTSLLNDKVLAAINAEIGERLKQDMGPEALLPAKLQLLMLALAKTD